MPRKQFSRCVFFAVKTAKIHTRGGYERKLSAKATAVRKFTASAGYGSGQTADGLNSQRKASGLERKCSGFLPFSAKQLHLATRSRSLGFYATSLGYSGVALIHHLAPSPSPSFAATPLYAKKGLVATEPVAVHTSKPLQGKAASESAPLLKYAKLSKEGGSPAAEAKPFSKQEAHKALRGYAALDKQQKRSILTVRRHSR